MRNLLPDILRGGVTAIMNVLLLFSLAQPKYGRRVTIAAACAAMLLDIASSVWFYRVGDLTALSRFDVILVLALGLALKPLVRESFMQWCFNFLTAINLMIIIIVLSYHLAGYLPAPRYANTALRFGFYLAAILSFRRYLRPLYRQVVENWQVFFFMVACIFLNFAPYFFFTQDIELTLADAKLPLYSLIALSAAAYGTIFFALRKISASYVLQTENLRMRDDEELLRLSAKAMAERLRLMDKAIDQGNLAAHDRRHFNGMVLGLLERGQVEEAAACLRRQNEAMPPKTAKYCENVSVNAAVCHYAALAESEGIRMEIDLAIPGDCVVDSLEFAMVVSNLLENAIHGAAALPDGSERYIRFSCFHVGRFLLEISNPCVATLRLGGDGYPEAEASGHGVGTRSVAAFAAKYGAELLYHVESGVFRVRLLV